MNRILDWIFIKPYCEIPDVLPADFLARVFINNMACMMIFFVLAIYLLSGSWKKWAMILFNDGLASKGLQRVRRAGLWSLWVSALCICLGSLASIILPSSLEGIPTLFDVVINVALATSAVIIFLFDPHLPCFKTWMQGLKNRLSSK